MVLIVLFALVSVVGDRSIVGNEDCFDLIDNDEDGQVDKNDMSCIQYPYADGNGENTTEPFQQNTGDKYLHGNSWDFWLNWFKENQYSAIPFCFFANPYDPTAQPEAFNSFNAWQLSPECPP